jgi:hypothetical protein
MPDRVDLGVVSDAVGLGVVGEDGIEIGGLCRHGNEQQGGKKESVHGIGTF